jgi:hypothetical protein
MVSAVLHAQSAAPAPCLLVKGSYRCNRTAFERTFAKARTVTVQTQPYDRNALREFGELITKLGKSIASKNADIALRLDRLDPDDTIFYGPGDRPLALLRVYSHGSLIWVENFSGQPDTAWAAVVYGVIQQFRTDAQ